MKYHVRVCECVEVYLQCRIEVLISGCFKEISQRNENCSNHYVVFHRILDLKRGRIFIQPLLYFMALMLSGFTKYFCAPSFFISDLSVSLSDVV
jgi:hypothetical protein